MPFFLSVSLVSSASKINSKVGQDLPAGKDNTPLSLGQVWVCFFKLFACFVCTYAQTQIWEQSLYNWPTILGSHKKTWDGHPGAYYHYHFRGYLLFIILPPIQVQQTTRISRGVKSTLKLCSGVRSFQLLFQVWEDLFAIFAFFFFISEEFILSRRNILVIVLSHYLRPTSLWKS